MDLIKSIVLAPRLSFLEPCYCYYVTEISVEFTFTLTGIPASGKTTLANFLCTRANEIISTEFGVKNQEAVAVIPMDGYHLPRSELDKLPNREEAYDRRGTDL